MRRTQQRRSDTERSTQKETPIGAASVAEKGDGAGRGSGGREGEGR